MTGIPFDPQQPPHLRYTPEQWTTILHGALAAHDAQAVKDANDALNAYGQPALEAGEHTLASGYGNPIEGIKGEAEGALGMLLGPAELLKTGITRGVGPAVDELIEGVKQIPKDIASGDPRRIGRGTFQAGMSIGAPFAKGTGVGAVDALIERPGIKNKLMKAELEQKAADLKHTNLTMQALEDLIVQRGAKAPLQEELLRGRVARDPMQTQRIAAQVEREPMQTESLRKRNTLLEGDIERSPMETENLGLRNQLLEAKLLKGEEGPITDPATMEIKTNVRKGKPAPKSNDPLDDLMELIKPKRQRNFDIETP